MLEIADVVQRVLVPFLAGTAVLLAALMLVLVIQRVVRERKWQRRGRVIARYQPVIDAIVQGGLTDETRGALQRLAAFERRIVAELLLAPLHSARGTLVAHIRDAAQCIGLVAQWQTETTDRLWWVRANAIRALGFIEERSSQTAMLRALDDDHPEVRAAAVDAAGRLGSAVAIPLLLARLADGSHHQRARVVDALRNLGPEVTTALVQMAHATPEHARLAAEVLGLIGTIEAIDPLVAWCADDRAEVRAAALGALGTIGLDERSHYFALRALNDGDPHARAMAARALGRGRREDAVNYLAERLDDEWLPAAEAAGALKRLGIPGRAALEARAAEESQAGDLARQMLWSAPAVTTPAS